MKMHEGIISDAKEAEYKVPAPEMSPEIKVRRAKIRVASSDQKTPQIGKITIRQSSDSPQLNYEIIPQEIRNSTDGILMPTVKLHRYDIVQSPNEKLLNNGLDPMALELISANLGTAKAASEYSDKSDESFNTPKISREMKNLQKSTNDSKILSNYLNTSSESPRNRRKKTPPPIDPLEMEEEEEIENEHEEIHESAESDSTVVVASSMDPPEKRRKSISRSRSHSRNAMRGRKKSIARQLKDELSLTSDKEETVDDEDEEMSESSFITSRSIEGRTINAPPKPGWDSFCFKCHTDTAVLSLACSKCKCSYHRHCVRPNPIPKKNDDFVCPECLEIEMAESSPFNKYGHDKIDLHTLAEMLTIILEKIRTYQDREHFETEIVVKFLREPNQSLIVTQMSLKVLETRIKTRFYKTTEAFIHDLKQLEHNWNIVDRSKSKTLKSILKYVNTEINELEACVYCYEESFVSGDWFVNPCKRPHLLIWAKLKGYPYWPAKVMSVDARQQVDVRFFGAHDRAWVPSVHCMLFSEKDPNKTKGGTPTNNKNASKTQKGIADAMKEKDDYIENLRAKFGFRYAPFREQFETSKLKEQLEAMLPGLNGEAKEGGEKELEKSQKEKLTLKIIKGNSSVYQIEPKSSEINKTPTLKEKSKIYKVAMAKNDDNAKEVEGKLKTITIKRKSNVEQDIDLAKRTRTASETSESSASAKSSKMAARRKSTREPAKQKKLSKSMEPPVKKIKNVEKPPKNENSASVDELPKAKSTRRRLKSVMPDMDQPLLVQLVIPPGTDEIQMLKEISPSPSPPPSVRTKKRSQSYNRTNDKDDEKQVKDKVRRQSVSISSPIKRSMSTNVDVTKAPVEPVPKEIPVEGDFNPLLVIKDEPVSDGEEQASPFTLSDIPKLMQDRSGKKMVIEISTNEENGDSSSSTSVQQLRGRARKTFPNNMNQRQIDQLGQGRNGNWMVCIPQTFLGVPSSTNQSQPASNRSTPVSESQVSLVPLRTNATSTPNSISSTPSTSNRVSNIHPVPPLTYSSNANNQRRNSIQTSNPMFLNGPNRRQSHFGQPPRLQPRPQGVFTNDGSAFHRDIGPVSRMFADNAYRVTDFFRNVIVDTISSFAPEIPQAENLMLRAENEKLQREMQTTKSDCQQKMQALRREHQEEMESMKRTYDERICAVQKQSDKDIVKVSQEVRHQCEIEKQRAIELTRKETKKTTWCSNCTKEARFYCCWNTSYCGQQCQKTHWQHHQQFCTNKNSATESQQQQQKQQIQQTNNESQLLTVSVPRSTILTMRSPQQQINSGQPPVSIQQHIILPHRTKIPVISQIPNHQIFFAQQQPFQNNNRTIQTIYPEKTAQQISPTNLTVQTFHRSDSPPINVISTVEPTVVRVNSNSTVASPAVTPTGQE